MPHVLLANDDGIDAPGLRALIEAFALAGWRITVSAPDRERSAASHSMTMRAPVVVGPARLPGIEAGERLALWQTDGTPVDCVKVALHQLCAERPDIVVSGINKGWNIGTDVHYSGTVGAAMEGAFEGLAAIAVSVRGQDAAQLLRAAALAVRFARAILDAPLPPETVLNVNLPDCAPEAMLGPVEAPLARLRYTDAYGVLPHTGGRSAHWLRGEVMEAACAPGSDLHRLLRGYATVTALGWDLTQSGLCAGILRD